MGLTKRLQKLRWDSSDPDRAPPPLPVPPGSPGLQTRSNASANIQAAAQKLSERATAAYTTNPMPSAPSSPEKSLIKGAQHRRMQSLQSGSVRDLRSYLDGPRTGSPERPASRSALSPSVFTERDSDYLSSPDRGQTTPTPPARDPLKDMPSLRPSTRAGSRSILGENTPPSAAMLALQTMTTRDSESPLGDVTNSAFMRNPQNWESIASQITNLTTISLALQKEMSQLNRRSKDNATDLVSLKEAANTRDEDIRKSLKELVSSLGTSDPSSVFGRASGFGLGLLDGKTFASPTSGTKPFSQMPRSTSHNSLPVFEPVSPNPFSVEGAASVAMLEKIIREMVTKEGQERLLTTLSDILDKHSKESVASVETQRKLQELADFIKQNPDSQALVRTSQDTDGVDAQRAEVLEAMNADIIRLLHQIKETASKSGGLSAEIKARVHELRGEVLGLGRDIGKKLDDSMALQDTNITPSDFAEQTRGHIEAIVNDGMVQLKEHIESIIRESSQQLVPATPPRDENGEDMFEAVKQALAEHSSAIVPAQQDALDRDGILQAVKEAYEEFKPEIELQQFGLERDEILQVLREGLIDYQNNREAPPAPGASMDEVMNAIQQALHDFNTSTPANELENLRQDLLTSVRNVLEEFRPDETANLNNEATRFAVIEAVKEGLAEHGPNAPRELEISRDDLFDAVKASLDGSSIPFGGFGERVLQQLRELVDEMKVEFKQYSAANGRDTEQVLDAVKDGLESLRVDVEQYVDRAQDVTGKDEIVDVVRTGLENLRSDVQGYVAEGPTNGRNQMLEYIKTEFEHLHEAICGQTRREGDESRPSSTSEILAALESGFKGLEGQVGSRSLLDDTNEEVMEAMKAEFDTLRDAIIAGSASHKDEVISSIQESLGNVRERVADGESTPGPNPEVMETMKEEFAHLRDVLAPLLLLQSSAADKDEIIDSIHQVVGGLREHITGTEGEESAQTLVAIKEQIEALHESLAGGLVRSGGTHGEAGEDSFADIKARLDEIAASHSGSDVSSELLEAIQGEFEQLKQSVAQTMVTGGSRADTEEVLDTVRLGLDDLRSHLDKKLDNPEHHMSLNNQLLDALNEGIEAMKADVTKAIDKPIDASVNYEILETLKHGLAELKVDMEKLTVGSRPSTPNGAGDELILANDSENMSREVPSSACPPSSGSLRERMEVLFAQFQIKIEGLAASIQDMPAHAAPSLPEGIEELLKDIQTGIAAIAAREKAEVDNAVTKDDTDAIETLLRNTKAQIEELPLSDPANAVTKEHLDAVEAVVRTTNEAIEGLALKVDENTANKADVAVVEVLVKDLREAFDTLKESLPKTTEDEESETEPTLTKGDLDVLGVLCTEIKEVVNSFAPPENEALPTKSDIEHLTGLINDFRESHDKIRESYEGDVSITAKAFDDRRKEAEQLIDQIATVKTFMEEVKDEILTKVLDGESGISTLAETLKNMDENMSGTSEMGADVKELLEAVKNEFERAHGSLEGIKVDHDQNSATLLEKNGEHKDEIVSAIIEKVDTCYDGMMSKYDDAQQAAEDKIKMMEEKALEQQEILANTREMTDELKLSIDTLGTSLTAFIPTFTEANEKMSEDHKTLFEKVDNTVLQFSEGHEAQLANHQTTHDGVAKVHDGVTGLQADFTEYHPRFLMELKEILALVNQHYGYSKSLSETAEQQAHAVKEQLSAHSEEHKIHVDGLKSQVDEPLAGLKAQLEELKAQSEALREGLAEHISGIPALMPPPLEAAEKYDDSAVHEKLDTLVNLAAEAGTATAQMARLDEIQEQVKATAVEMSAFIALQNKQITDGQESKEREAEEVALLLERRMVQKDNVEGEITALNEEKESLTAVVEALRAEKDALTAQKARLNVDVSSLQMALNIRKEELHDMDAKADALERRILEGLIDHSRAMLLTKQTPRPSPKKPAGRDLRIPSDAPPAKVALPVLDRNHALAMKTRPLFNRRNGAAPNSGERRIMSLSQISQNVPSGGTTAAASSTASPSLVSATGHVSRSHSVKTHKLRKRSWGPLGGVIAGGDKENHNDGCLPEEDSDLDDVDSSHYSSRPVSRDQRPVSRDSLASSTISGSEAGTERRSISYAPTVTESHLTYGTGSSYTEGPTPTDDGRRTSYGTYDTGSYMTGSELETDAGRRTSYGSTIRSTVGAQTINEQYSDEESEYPDGVSDMQSEIQRLAEQAHIEHLAEQEREAHAAAGTMSDGDRKQMVPYGSASDSGLGSDLPTAHLTGSESSYFQATTDTFKGDAGTA